MAGLFYSVHISDNTDHLEDYMRNICDECKYCEFRDTATISDCFAICGNPLDVFKEIENRRNKEDDKRRLELENRLM